jgi:enediyne biosynthesis protein E4
VYSSGGNLVNGSTWADYDNDGCPDVFIYGGSGHNLLFHNNRNGTFTQVHGAPFDTDLGPSGAATWGDYDNDGFLDLFVTNGNFDTIQRRNYLYHNNGDGTFTKITTGAIATDMSSSIGAGWEDFDNDGHLDLFLTQSTGNSGPARRNLLYHNNGDGTFTSLTTTVATADSGSFAGITWGDYDNEGFPDLFAAAGQPSYIYHNEGHTNHWLTFKLVGTASNRSAIGAKVRVKTTIGGKTYSQMRSTSSDGLNGNSLNAHFGRGDAAVAATVRIEWPSGTVQEFQNVAAKQVLDCD